MTAKRPTPRDALAGLTLALLHAATPAIGANPASAAQDERGTWSFIWENDVFSGTDRNYTNGNRLSYVSPAEPWDAGLHGAVGRALFDADRHDRVRYGLAVGQDMFTPENIEAERPLPDQHPYAGWLYGEYSVYVQEPDRLHIAALQIGMVGPAAGAEFTQDNFHDLINSPEANGWDNQLKNEPAFALLLERQTRALVETGFNGLELDLTPHIGGSLGTLRTQAKAGLTLRFGTDLRRDFGPPRVRPAIGGTGFFEGRNGLSWYAFAGLEGRMVARNIFLDGNTFRDSPSVDKEPLVMDAQAGLVTTLGRARIAYTAVIRSPQFERQDPPHVFGSVSLSFKF
ncbi:lipid A deacylase LpxR family protein [Limimonas halophila]|nr:lipid A deacylase LpxR family protein [Limimonas halophila]